MLSDAISLIKRYIFSRTPIEVNFFLLFFGGHFKMHCGKKPFVAATLTLFCRMTGLIGNHPSMCKECYIFFYKISSPLGSYGTKLSSVLSSSKSRFASKTYYWSDRPINGRDGNYKIIQPVLRTSV